MKRFTFLLGLCGLLALGACSDDQHYVVIEVTGRPAVHDVKTLRITLANEGSMRVDDYDVSTHPLPITFSVTSTLRTGDLGIQAEALDAAGLTVGRGSGASSFEADTATLMLDTTDFVVNTNVADDQYLSNDYNANGNQLAAMPDGTWMATYREKCQPSCHMFGRRFDQDGRPLESVSAASTMAFPLSTILTSGLSTPAVAGTAGGILAFWDFEDVAAQRGVACRAIDATGKALGTQSTIALDTADTVVVTPLSNNNFAVSWNSQTIPGKITSAIVQPDCTTLGGPGITAPIATEASGEFFQLPEVAASSDGNILYTWISGNDVHARVARNTNQIVSADTIVVKATSTARVVYSRAVPFADGFAVIARWIPLMGDGPGRIDMWKVAKDGTVKPQMPLLVTDKSGGNFATVDSFGSATRADGTVMVVWHACGVDGDGSGCGVFARAMRPTGPVGETFMVPTTTALDQTDPSVVSAGDAWVFAWNDLSTTEPDPAGSAVRARIMYVDGATN